MAAVKKIWFILFSIILTCLFFYKFFFYGYIPFPGDLLVAEYKPWSSYSYLGYNPGSYPNKAQYFDTLRQLYPWKTLVIKEWKKGIIPFWNPHNFSGTPLLANFQSGAMYPLNFLYVLFNQETAWTFLVILEPFLAFIFTFLYTRTMKLSKLGSLFASSSFAFSSYMTVWLEYNTVGHVILWLPLVLLSIEKLRLRLRQRWIIVLLSSLAFSLLAGHPQVFSYVFIFSLLYALSRIREQAAKRKVFLLFLLALGIDAITLIPGIELIANAARSPLAYDAMTHKILIQPWQLIMLIVPDFFGNPATRNYWVGDTYVGKVLSIGIIPLFFGLAAIRARFDTKKFFMSALIVVLVLTTNNPVTQILYGLNIPILTGSSPTLMTFLFQFSLAVLCGYGINEFRKEKHTMKKFIFRTIQIAIFFAVLWIVTIKIPSARRPILYETILAGLTIVGFAIAISRRKFMTAVLIVLFAVHIGDLFYAFGKFNPFSPKEFIYPPAPITEYLKSKTGLDRFWGLGNASIEANFATQLSLYSPDGYDPLYPRWYGEFIESSRDGKIHAAFTRDTRSDATIAPSSSSEFSTNFARIRVLNLLGVRYILDRSENLSTASTFPPDKFSLLYNNDNWKVLENKSALPRAFLVSDYRIYSSREEFEKMFFDRNFDASSTVLLTKAPAFKPTHNEDKGSATIIAYGANSMTIKTNAPGDRLLFLSDVFYPGWKVFVDNAQTSVIRADWAFRAVSVPKGAHIVRFIYDPISWKIGLLMSVMSILVTGIIIAKSHETK